MMQYKPFLLLNRLVVVKGNLAVYDEAFHAGVNIIRGKNSSGKSTIMDFIFYGLGGDLTKLKNEAKACDYVFIEVCFSGKTFTLKRLIKESGRQGMDIYSGDYLSSMSAKITDWTRYPYNADTKESFYQVIFKELGIPYSKSEDKNSITMHQLLRMMYVDQMTSPDRLFKFDKFDSPNKRKAIGELLLGLSDFSLYEQRVSLQRYESLLDLRVKEIKTIHSFLGGSIKTLEEIDIEISDYQNRIDCIEKEIETINSKESQNSHESDSENRILEDLSIQVQRLREERARISDNITNISLDINDSQLFIKSLSARLKALRETKDTISALSDIAFHHCPACQAEIIKQPTGCSLCGTNYKDQDADIDPTFKVRKEIEFQIDESCKLINMRQFRLTEYKAHLVQVETKLGELERELDIARKPQRTVSLELRQKIKDIGSTLNKIEYLNSSKEKYSKLYSLYEERDTLQEQVNKLKDIIGRLEAGMVNEVNRKKLQISKETLEILRADTGHEEIFVEGQKVEFDFADDRVTIDERALFSASSMVYLKNAFRLALLKLSCQDKSYLYPRFLLMDNVEDKGMKEERSQLFQREIIKASQSLNTVHQIIFTTSMIAEEFDNTDLCVGDFYTKDHKTLRMH